MKKKIEEKIIKLVTKSPIGIIALFILITIIISLGISNAASTYLMASDYVTYDNSTSGLISTNAHDALDELYFHATDYSEIKNKIGNNELTYNWWY